MTTTLPQPSTPKVIVADAQIEDFIVKSVRNVFATMIRREASLQPIPTPSSSAGFQVLSNVGFVGEANGVVYLCLTDDFANFAVREILGLSQSEIDRGDFDMAKDAIGEITNMTAGGFKNQLCDAGFRCKLTLPTIVRGEALSVAPIRHTTQHSFQFECAGHLLVADIRLKEH